MRRYHNILNESLLDDVEIDEVQDDDSEDDNIVNFVFIINFDTNDTSAAVIKNMIFNVALSPVLERLKSDGYLESWNFTKKIGNLSDDPIIDVYAKATEGIRASVMFSSMRTLSLTIGFRVSVLNRSDMVGYVCAGMMRALMASRICTGSICLSFRPERPDSEKPEIVYCVYYIVREKFHRKWTFYAGTTTGNVAPKSRAALAGCFVRSAAKMGILHAVDNNNSRYVVFGFGLSSPDNTLSVFDSEGNRMTERKVNFDFMEIGDRFMDNGLLYVRFDYERSNYVRMDGSLFFDKDVYSCSKTFSEGYASVVYEKFKSNLVDKDGNRLCGEDYICVENFVDGLATVVRGTSKGFRSGTNIIDKTGKPLLDDWYHAIDFGDVRRRVVARVGNYENQKWTYRYVNRNGKYLTGWISGNCKTMNNGFAEVKINDLYNYLKEDGTMLFDNGFKETCGWPECGVVAVMVDNQWQFIDTETKELLFDGKTFKKVSTDTENMDGSGKMYYIAKNDVQVNDNKIRENEVLISAEGVQCTDKMFYSVRYVGNDFVSVSDGPFSPVSVFRWGKGVVLDNLQSCDSFKNRYAMVSRRVNDGDNGYHYAYNYMDADGNLFSADWHDDISTYSITDDLMYGMHDGFIVMESSNILTRKGVLLFGKDGKNIKGIHTVVPDELVVVEIMDKAKNAFLYNMFDADGNRLLKEWTTWRIFPDGNGLVRVGPESYVDYSGNFTSLI